MLMNKVRQLATKSGDGGKGQQDRS